MALALKKITKADMLLSKGAKPNQNMISVFTMVELQFS